MEPLKILTAIMAIIFLSSFRDKLDHEFIGTYGVSDTDPSQIKLVINSDNTFYYQDFSNSSKKIIATGNWILEGKKLILKNTNSKMRFHNVWTFKENGQSAKSRKGFTFYRLGKKDI